MVTRTLVKLYLLAYNLICCVIWGMVLIQVIKEYTESRNFAAIFNRVKEYLYFVQTLAVLEIFHSMIGIVRRSS